VKAKVTLVEAHKMGGDCLNYGCVPSKALIRTARLAHQMRHGARYGLSDCAPAFSFQSVMQRIHAVIAAIEPHDSVERYTGLGVEVLQGYAKIVNPWTVEIALNDGSKQTLTTRAIVIAAGAKPGRAAAARPGRRGLCHQRHPCGTPLRSSKRCHAGWWCWAAAPSAASWRRASSAWARRSRKWKWRHASCCAKTLDVSQLALESLQADGVQVLTGHKALRCERQGQQKFIVVEHAGAEQRIEFDALICAVGRVARLTGYGLEELGIPTNRTVETNEYLQTIYPNIYAAGDVAGPFQFTHTAAHQAWTAAVNALFGDVRKFKTDDSVIPRATFIDPEVACVGLNELEARRKRALPSRSPAMASTTWTARSPTAKPAAFVKVLTVPGKDRILGVTIVGTHAGDLLAEYVLAMKHGLGLNKILGTIHTYPTLAEANKYAAGEWKRAHAPARLLAWARRYHDWKRR
jgi:pyruvate/2-oxoglutarate dehydrogenase complex dihydrolipoamide dehydrogenase (E3) component